MKKSLLLFLNPFLPNSIDYLFGLLLRVLGLFCIGVVGFCIGVQNGTYTIIFMIFAILFGVLDDIFQSHILNKYFKEK